MKARIGVIGAGSWGTTLADLLAKKGHEVTLWAYEPELVEEGCLSVPGFYFPRRRYPFARVTGIDLDGNPVELSGDGLMAQALQHETDHLDGKLYIEGLDKETKRDAMRLIRESDWF